MLTNEKKRLAIFANGISVDESLPKYTRVQEELRKRNSLNNEEHGVVPLNNTNNPFMDTELVDIARGDTFEQFRDMDTHSINVYLSEKEYKHFMNGGRYSFLTNNGSTSFVTASGSALSMDSVPVPIKKN